MWQRGVTVELNQVLDLQREDAYVDCQYYEQKSVGDSRRC